MHGIDTNVLVRMIVKDDELQARKALQYIKKHKEIFISHLVLCEFSWVCSTCYDFTKVELLKVIDHILRTDHFVFEQTDTLWSALHEYKVSNADFSDCLLGAIAKHRGSVHVGTFDKKAARLSFFEWIG